MYNYTQKIVKKRYGRMCFLLKLCEHGAERNILLPSDGQMIDRAMEKNMPPRGRTRPRGGIPMCGRPITSKRLSADRVHAPSLNRGGVAPKCRLNSPKLKRKRRIGAGAVSFPFGGGCPQNAVSTLPRTQKETAYRVGETASVHAAVSTFPYKSSRRVPRWGRGALVNPKNTKSKRCIG